MTQNVVVALGPVDEELIRPILGSDCVLVSEPNDAQLAVASAAIVRANVTVDRAMFDRMPNLRVLARTGVGTDRIDLETATERGIPVVITPGSNTRAVAEGALAMMLSLVKSLPQLDGIVREGGWSEREHITIGDIDGATVGLVGFGRIGQRLAELLEVLGATVIAFDPVAHIPHSVKVDALDDLLQRSDIVSLHLPLLASTRHIMNEETIGRMKRGALLINCSRGPLVDLDAAFAALTTGQLGGIALDVFDDEPPAPHPVYQHPSTQLSPHVMGLSTKAAAQTFLDAAKGVRTFLDGGHVETTANEV